MLESLWGLNNDIILEERLYRKALEMEHQVLFECNFVQTTS